MKHILSILSLGFIAYVQAQVYKGNYCEYIVPTDLPAKGNNCNNDGYKFVVKGNNVGANKIRKQFLYVDGKVIIAFVENGKKFADCTSFTDVTGSVNCKLVTGLPGTSLTSTSGGGGCSKCGVRGAGTKIVGGVETGISEFPWYAALSFSTSGSQASYGCGASLISAEWVVCAAHCFKDSQGIFATTATVSIVLGDHNRNNPALTPQRKVFRLSKIIVHPSYDPTISDLNDISLLKLSTKADLSVFTPICLPAAGQTYVGQTSTVIGFGDTSEGGSVSNTLQKVDLPVVNIPTCQAAQGNSIKDTGMICAGGIGGQDSCQGDSGGPLSVRTASNTQDEQIGIVSFGPGCARPGLYGVYTDVSFYKTFIDEQIAANGGATFCTG